MFKYGVCGNNRGSCFSFCTKSEGPLRSLTVCLLQFMPVNAARNGRQGNAKSRLSNNRLFGV